MACLSLFEKRCPEGGLPAPKALLLSVLLHSLTLCTLHGIVTFKSGSPVTCIRFTKHIVVVAIIIIIIIASSATTSEKAILIITIVAAGAS